MLREGPFHWLAAQPFDHAAGFATLRGAALRRETEGVNRWVLARGHVRIERPSDETCLSIMVDGRYRLWLDGVPIGRGPVRASPHFARFDRYPLRLAKGSHVIAVLVHVPGVDLAWYETVKGAWQPVFGDGALWVRLAADDVEQQINWRMMETDAWRRDTPRAGWGQDFIEDHDARRIDPAWPGIDFDDSGWPRARAMVSLGGPAETARGFGRVEPFPSLLASEIPHPVEREIPPARLLWTRGVAARPEQPIDKRLFVERLLDDCPSRIQHAHALFADDDEAAVIWTTGDEDTALMLAFDPYHCGRPFIELDAKGGEVVELAVAEALPGEFGRGVAGDGLRAEGHLGVAHLFRYTARPGRQRFDKFNATAVRAMQLVVRNAPHGLRIRRIGSVATHFPARQQGAFDCSDPFLRSLWETSRYTVLQCMHDSWIDCPGREARQWVGDAFVQFDVAALAFGADVFPLQRQFLRHAAEGQRADGLIRMFAPGDIAADALTIPDFTLLWVIAADRYYRASGDLETVEAIFPAIECALAWFDRHRDRSGLLASIPQWHFIEWADLDRQGEAAAINALFAGALQAAACLADALARPGLAARYQLAWYAIADALNTRHWDEERGVYVDSVDPLSGQRGRRVSQHGNALMLLFDLAPPERAGAIVSAITDSARLKLTAAPPIVPDGQPFDDEHDIVRANSFFAHFVYSGIAQAGGLAWLLEDLRARYGPMLAAGTTTLWESFAPSASLCHGFSATPLFQMSRYCLGIEALAPGFRRFRVAPGAGSLGWARGAVPTPDGPITIAWTRDGNRLRVEVRHPGNCDLEAGDDESRRLISRSRRADGTTDLLFDLRQI